ncbi:3-keto-disaccharide hydrolase [Planctomicrobium sp. SH527]|uniref:3-keto-disaccharide hydrolase n=1 Tax=Planctomicrobium sp. SH527 TaxID=3448123 RepID=UPI003F5B3238
MLIPKLSRVLLVLSVLFVFPASARAETRFERIFDGETLTGWKAMDMSYWSVRDGAITGQSTPEHLCKSNQFIVWQGGDVGDFELKLKFRVSGNRENTGVQFRSVLRPDGQAVGYQADILKSGGYLGGVCDELHERKGPELLSANGQKTIIEAAGNRTATPLGPMATMRPPGEWNEYRIIAKGQHIILEINGVKSTELIDQEEGHFDLSGFLGLQLRAGEPMMVQFKDIYLKKL